MVVGQLYRQVRDQFRKAQLSTPELDARRLVGAGLGLALSDLLLKEDEQVTAVDEARVLAFAEQRLEGMPVGRILGEREFYGRTFHLNEATLEPRPDTETLIEAVLERCDRTEPSMMCDIGTGTGAIAVTLLSELPMSQMIAVDLSERALVCAQENARLHHVDARFWPVCADYVSALREGLDWVISNPPYIRTAALSTLSTEVVQHDPILALDGGEDGLKAYGEIVTGAKKLLRPGGWIALEIGFDQASDLKKQLRHHGFGAIEIIKDLSGNDRVVVARGT